LLSKKNGPVIHLEDRPHHTDIHGISAAAATTTTTTTTTATATATAKLNPGAESFLKS